MSITFLLGLGLGGGVVYFHWPWYVGASTEASATATDSRTPTNGQASQLSEEAGDTPVALDIINAPDAMTPPAAPNAAADPDVTEPTDAGPTGAAGPLPDAHGSTDSAGPAAPDANAVLDAPAAGVEEGGSTSIACAGELPDNRHLAHLGCAHIKRLRDRFFDGLKCRRAHGELTKRKKWKNKRSKTDCAKLWESMKASATTKAYVQAALKDRTGSPVEKSADELDVLLSSGDLPGIADQCSKPADHHALERRSKLGKKHGGEAGFGGAVFAESMTYLLRCRKDDGKLRGKLSVDCGQTAKYLMEDEFTQVLNKARNQLETPGTSVSDGQWTLDKFLDRGFFPGLTPCPMTSRNGW